MHHGYAVHLVLLDLNAYVELFPSPLIHSEILHVDKQTIKKDINRTIMEQKEDAGDREIWYYCRGRINFCLSTSRES